MIAIKQRIYSRILERLASEPLDDRLRTYLSEHLEDDDAMVLAELRVEERKQDENLSEFFQSDKFLIPYNEARDYCEKVREDVQALWKPTWEEVHACSAGYEELSEEARRYVSAPRREDAFSGLPRLIEAKRIHPLVYDAERRAYVKLFKQKLEAVKTPEP